MAEYNRMNHEQFSVLPRGSGKWGNGVIIFMTVHHLISDDRESWQPVFIQSGKLPSHSGDLYHIYSDKVPPSPDVSQSHLLLTEKTVFAKLNESIHSKAWLLAPPHIPAFHFSSSILSM